MQSSKEEHGVMLISDEYRKLNEQLHESRLDFGCWDEKYRDLVIGMLHHFNGRSFLSYGSGKGTLGRSLRTELARIHLLHKFTLFDYDPAVDWARDDPPPCDIVAACDVMEHIEPGCLNEVIAHIADKTKMAAFMSVATRPAVKTLADGRNAHLIVENWRWWADRIDPILPISTVNVNGPGEVHFFCVAKGHINANGTSNGPG